MRVGALAGSGRGVRAGRGGERGRAKTAGPRRSPGPMNKTAGSRKSRRLAQGCVHVTIRSRERTSEGAAAASGDTASRPRRPGQHPDQPGRRLGDDLRLGTGGPGSNQALDFAGDDVLARCRRTSSIQKPLVGLMPEILLKLVIVNSQLGVRRRRIEGQVAADWAIAVPKLYGSPAPLAEYCETVKPSIVRVPAMRLVGGDSGDDRRRPARLARRCSWLTGAKAIAIDLSPPRFAAVDGLQRRTICGDACRGCRCRQRRRRSRTGRRRS